MMMVMMMMMMMMQRVVKGVHWWRVLLDCILERGNIANSLKRAGARVSKIIRSAIVDILARRF